MKEGRVLVVTVVTDESLMEVAGGIMEGRAATEDTELSMEVAGGVNIGRAVIEDVVSVEPSLKGCGVLVGTRPIATDISIICNERVLSLV